MYYATLIRKATITATRGKSVRSISILSFYVNPFKYLAPWPGLEPGTFRLTAERSTN